MTSSVQHGAGTVDLTRIAAGLGNPVHDAQATFRRVLDGFARPGRIQVLPPAVLQGLGHPHAFSPALAAALLTLLDAETALWLSPALRGGETEAWCRFHTGTQLVDAPEAADFAAARAAEVDAPLWGRLRAGSDEAPHTSATLLIEAASLFDAEPPPHSAHLLLSGPGIEHQHRLGMEGLAPALWRSRIAQQPAFPCGVDLLLCCDARVAALPRSTQITLMEG